TTYEVDSLGRTTKVTDPNGNISYTVYDDVNHAVRTYAGWNSSTNLPTGPTQVSREDRAGSYTETLTMTATPHLTAGRDRDDRQHSDFVAQLHQQRRPTRSHGR